MAAAATFTYDYVAGTIDAAVTGATIGIEYRVECFDDFSTGDIETAASTSFTMQCTGVGSSPVQHVMVYLYETLSGEMVGATIFNISQNNDEYVNPATWSYDGVNTVTLTLASTTNGEELELDSYLGGFTEYVVGDVLTGNGGPLVMQVVGAHTQPFVCEVYNTTGLYQDYGVRIFTPGVSGQGIPGNPNTVSPVQTEAPSGVTTTSATFEAEVNPEGVSSTVAFEYGYTTSYGSTTPSQAIGSGSSLVPVSQLVSGLRPGRTYHYRAVRTP